MFGRVRIQHKLSERTMQPSNRSLENNKTRTRQFGGRFEIHTIKAGADIDVIFHFKIEAGHGAPALDFNVVVFISPYRHIHGRQVRQSRGEAIDLFKQYRQPGF